eukprot:15240378-Heterocapsa_arctica.AAC.1
MPTWRATWRRRRARLVCGSRRDRLTASGASLLRGARSAKGPRHRARVSAALRHLCPHGAHRARRGPRAVLRRQL